MIIGQVKARQLLAAVANTRSNILLVGSPGTGKTLLARAYLSRFKGRCLELTGSKDIPSTYVNYTTVFIDEAHRLKNPELLFPLLADEGTWSLFPWGGRKKHVFAMATTDQGLMFPALVSRLTMVAIEPYSEEEICAIVRQLIPRQPAEIASNIAYFSHRNPRRAEKLVEIVTASRIVDTIPHILDILGYRGGFNAQERQFVAMLRSGPRSVSTLSGMLGVGTRTIKTIESALIAADMVEITSKGRSLTAKGYDYADYFSKESINV
uniref:Putative RuvB domain containing protein n=1 Tax=viral metagenome TaxID=1070528 RepID=A0A6M3LI00_9ZZZZ